MDLQDNQNNGPPTGSRRMDRRKKANILPFFRRMEKELNVLVVEDDRIERAFLEEQIKELGHKMVAVENGHEAIEHLNQSAHAIDIIMMDRMMPVMDGLSAVRHIKDNADLRRIPIIMVTAAATPQEFHEGLEAGVFYYLTKPVDSGVLKSVLCAAGREAEQMRNLYEELERHQTSFDLIHTCKFNFRTLEETESLAAFIAHCFPDPQRALPGLAELMMNAIEHGTYEIGYERKTQLIENGTLRAEIVRRQSLDEYKDRFVEAIITRKEEGVYAVITDQGSGFDWHNYLQIEPARAHDNHGRGIAQARALSFDKITYNATGNQVVCFMGHSRDLEW